MLVVLIIIGIIFLCTLVFLGITLSTLNIEIVKFNVSGRTKDDFCENSKKTETTINDYLIYVRIYLFNKIKLFSFKINNKKIAKLQKSKMIRWIDKKINMKIEEEVKDITKLIIKERKRIFTRETLEHIKMLNMKIISLKMKLDISTEDAMITSYLTAIIASLLSILLACNVDNFRKEKYSYTIRPVYIDQNFFKLDFNCIIGIKMVHIMNIIYLLIRKRSEERHDRTSNRRSYDYSYGQHSRHG